MQSVLNVRMDSVLKERGDKVLADHGISVSAAVRALWTQLANTRTIPDFIQDIENDEEEKQRKIEAIEKLCSIGRKHESDEVVRNFDYKAARDEMYEDMWQRYLELK